MSIEALLQNKSIPLEIDGNHYTTRRFKVRDWNELRTIFRVIQDVLADKPDDMDFEEAMLTNARLEAWTLVYCGSTISQDEIMELDRIQFITAFTAVVATNADFFAGAAHQFASAQAKRMTKTN